MKTKRKILYSFAESDDTDVEDGTLLKRFANFEYLHVLE
jgi:hypothetical protein